MKTRPTSKHAQCPNILGSGCIIMHYSSYKQNMAQKTQVLFWTPTGRQKSCHVRMDNEDPCLHKTENSHGEQPDVGGVRKQGNF